MTVDMCKEYCRDQGWEIAGVESNDECFCGNEDLTDLTYSDSFCDRTCPGNTAQICGGHWALNAYTLSGKS